MRRGPATYLAAIAVVFAILLPLYYVFSYGKNDSLERTIEGGKNNQGGSTYNAPFSYGGSYLESLVFGILGMVLVFAVFYTVFLVMRKRRMRGE
jgi:ABC-type Fe3+ transport system permease subunit